jgi:hypothetical protein
MTDSSYKVDNILKSYSKHNKAKASASSKKNLPEDEKYVDVVTLDSSDKAAVYDKISYSLRDALTKSRKNDI